MEEFYSRTYQLFGDSLERVIASHVAVVGVGGVGGSAALALARGGVGKITLIDGDVVSESNLNRQAVAFRSGLGKPKVEEMARLISDINPNCKVNAVHAFYSEKTRAEIDAVLSGCDYVLDAIDQVREKTELICMCHERGIPVISAMGAGNKLDPTRFVVCDISKTHDDALAKVMRKRLRDKGINHTKVVFSSEAPVNNVVLDGDGAAKRVPASCSFVPPVVGMIMAGECIKDISGVNHG